MGVRVSFLEKAQPAAAQKQNPGVLAPAAAIVSGDDGDIAFVVADEKVQRRALKLGRTLGEDREVLEGLAGGDTVVLDPPEELIDGAQVRVANEDSTDNE